MGNAIVRVGALLSKVQILGVALGDRTYKLNRQYVRIRVSCNEDRVHPSVLSPFLFTRVEG